MCQLFSQNFEELAKCSQNMSHGQCEVSTYLVYRHILKSIVKKTLIKFVVHMQSAALLTPDNKMKKQC